MSLTENTEILKELNNIEELFERGQQRGDFLNPRAFIIKSEYDLIQNKEVVLNAIEKWKSIHPLLNVRIIKKDDENGKTKYFKIFDGKKCFNDIKFLRYQTENPNELSDCWKLFFENELTVNFEAEKSIWRLFFIQLSSPNEYCVLFNIHHSITDGRNAYAVVQELLKIIEDYFEHGQTQIKNEQSDFEINFDIKSQLIENQNGSNDMPPPDMQPEDVIKEYMKPVNTENSFSDEYSSYNGHFVEDNNKELIKASDIIENRPKHYCRLKWINISNEDFVYLTLKCKEKAIKLTGFFELVTALAMYRALLKHSNESGLKLKINYGVTVNMRPFFNPKFEYTTMGDLMTAFMADLVFETDNLKREEFWSQAKTCTTRLHTYLDNKQFLDKKAVEMMEKSFEFLDIYNMKDVISFYALTNIGKVEPCMKSSYGKIKIEKYYSSCSFTSVPTFNAAFISICSIENSLLWAISYNNFYLKNELIQDWVNEIHALIRQFI